MSKLLLGNNIAGEAFRMFDRWLAEHDPEGNMEILEATLAYGPRKTMSANT